MAYDRNTIMQAQLPALRAYLDANGIHHRDGRGDYQLLQIAVEKGWGVICTNELGMVSSDPKLRPLLNHFRKGKPFTVRKDATVSAAPETATPAEDAEYLNDLRDSLAVAIVQHGGAHTAPAKEIWAMADRLMAARTPYPGKEQA